MACLVHCSTMELYLRTEQLYSKLVIVTSCIWQTGSDCVHLLAKWAFETLFFCNYYQWQHKLHVVAYVNKKLTGVLPRRLSAQYENEREASKPCVTQLLTYITISSSNATKPRDGRKTTEGGNIPRHPFTIHSFSREEKPHLICSKDRNITLLLRFKFPAGRIRCSS
jgi:hypothetical protein